MSEVLAETPDEIHANLLETDYWLSLGLVLGPRDPAQARQLLEVIEAHEAERATRQEQDGGPGARPRRTLAIALALTASAGPIGLGRRSDEVIPLI